MLSQVCFSLLLVGGTLATASAVAVPATSCGQQAKCLTWMTKALPATHNNCGGDCQFEVCAIVDTIQCKGSSRAALESACVAGQDVCGSDITSAFDEWGVIRLGHLNRVCQVGLGGTTLHFPMHDGQHCVGQTPAFEFGDGSQASCAPRTAGDPSCSAEVVDCVWKVALPPCRSGFTLTTVEAAVAAVAGAVVVAAALSWRDLRLRAAAAKAEPSSATQPVTADVCGPAQRSVSAPDTNRLEGTPTLHYSSSQGTLEAESV